MTKKDLIKKILELGKELEKADGFDAVMIINDMEIEVDNYTKQLPIQNVVQQSEQLVCPKCGNTGRCEPRTLSDPDGQECDCFSAEDMIKAFNAGGKHIYECEANGKDKKCYCRNDNDCNQRHYISAEEWLKNYR